METNVTESTTANQTASAPSLPAVSAVRYFHRDGTPCERRIYVESAHVASYQTQLPCDRCGGAGGGSQWSHTGWTCYACGGSGKGKILGVKVYSAEKLAKLNAVAEKREAKAQEKRRVEALKAAERRTATRCDILAANPGLEAALAVEHAISRDLAARLDSYGSLSPAQIALVLKIAAEASAPKPAKLSVPEGRQTIDGLVASTKEVESVGYGGYGGTTWKMLVEVTTPEGSYRVFGTIPSALLGRGIKGSHVRFTATLTAKEPGFGFFSRPTGAEIVEPAKEEN